MALRLNKLEFYSSKGALYSKMSSPLDFLKSSIHFHYVTSCCHSLEKGVALKFNKLVSPLSKGSLWQVWLKLAKWIWLSCRCISLCPFISPWKTTRSFIKTTLNLFHPKVLRAKFDWNFLTVTVKNAFSNITIKLYIPLMSPSYTCTFTEGCFIPSLVESSQRFWCRRVLKVVDEFYVRFVLLEKGVALQFDEM